MKSLIEVEAAIQKLSAIEVRQLAEWLQTYLNTEGNTEHAEETEQKVTFVQNQQNAWDVLESVMATVEPTFRRYLSQLNCQLNWNK